MFIRSRKLGERIASNAIALTSAQNERQTTRARAERLGERRWFGGTRADAEDLEGARDFRPDAWVNLRCVQEDRWEAAEGPLSGSHSRRFDLGRGPARVLETRGGGRSASPAPARHLLAT